MSHTYATAPAPATTQQHATAPTPTWATAQAPTSAYATAPAPPANFQCHLTLGPHMFCLCVHVSHPCTCGIVRQAPPVSPAKCQSH
ncbi:hypothetical protein O181_045330 [Austropuccinia psidii MF-1]|uniref:Uncharacterized protein n=1 Tax=Austropuccinia psidii MF-1 TaxID=1389203 RepID=A0A9Q3HL39_9BASI|nr:hypothetical protein [Austropuccinia psidii MF-1]